MDQIPSHTAEEVAFAFDNCQHQGCQCKTCDHDKRGNCAFNEGDCFEAQHLGRCPVKICPNYLEKK